MTKAEKQQQLDVAKWVDSENKGYDCCGTYDYCVKCDKEKQYPCAVAYDAFTKPAKPAAKKPAAKKSAAKKTATK